MGGVIESLAKHRIIRDISVEYSVLYHRCVASAKPPKCAWPSDLHVPHSNFAEIVGSMTRAARVTMSLEAIHRAKRRTDSVTKHNLTTKLVSEVHEGMATVLRNSTGHLERMVSLAVLELQLDDGRILVQIGFHEHGEVKATCRLPQELVGAGQNPADVLNTFVSTVLKPFEDYFTIESVETDNTLEQPESRHEVQTRYVKTVFRATLHDQSDVRVQRCSAGPSSRVSVASSASSRGSSWGVWSKDGPLGRELQASDVFAVWSQTGFNFFTWLLPYEFDLLSKPVYERYLQSVMKSLQLEVDAIPL